MKGNKQSRNGIVMTLDAVYVGVIGNSLATLNL